MDLRELRYLVAVADEGSVTAAAAACHVAQPSLSQAVKSLERELGVLLLHRVGRRVVLTPAGEAVVAAARDTLRAADAIRDRVSAVEGLLAGRLDLVALPTLAAEPLAGLVGAFRSRHPGVTVRVRQPDDPSDLLELVRSGQCEVGITETGPRAAGIVARPLAEQELVAVTPPGSPSPKGPMPLRELARLPVVASPTGTSSRRVLDEALAAVGLRAQVAVEAEQREMLLPLVLAGAGVAVLPAPQAATAAAQGAVVRRLSPRLRRGIAIVHRDAPLSPAAVSFVALAAEHGEAAEAVRERRR